jgi:hypothetical protein
MPHPILNLSAVTFDDMEENGIYTSSHAQIGAREIGLNLTVLPSRRVLCSFNSHRG